MACQLFYFHSLLHSLTLPESKAFCKSESECGLLTYLLLLLPFVAIGAILARKEVATDELSCSCLATGT